MDEQDTGVAKLNRRRFLRGTAVVGAGAVALGAGVATKRSTAFAAPAVQTGGKIVFALSSDDITKVQPLLDDYQKSKGVTIETQTFPYASLYEKLNINLTQATGAYDVCSMDDPWMPLFAGNEFLMNLDDIMKKKGVQPDPDFVPELYALGDFPKGSGQRGIPWVGNVQVFAWRSDVLKDMSLEPPKTWDEVLSNAEKITTAKKSSDLYGIGLRGQAGNPATTTFLPVLRGYGGDIFKSVDLKNAGDAEPQLTTEQAKAAMKTLLALAKLAPPGVENVGHEENGRNVYTGRIAQDGDIWPDQLLQMWDPKLSKVVGKIDLGPEPAQSGVKPANMTGNWLLGIPEGSKNADLAFDFIVWFTAKEQQKRLLLDQNIPATRLSVLQDKDAVAKLPFLPGLLQAGRNAVPRPRTEHYPAVEDILGRYVAQAIAGQIDGDTALTNANKEIRDLMVREGVLKS